MDVVNIATGNARVGIQCGTYPPAGSLPRSWSTPWPWYTPVDVTTPELATADLATCCTPPWIGDTTTDPTVIDWTPRQAAALVPFAVVNGWPLNPAGRTGRTGRSLGRWGENAAADPIVIAGTGRDRKVLLIERDDCRQWAIPGGMVDPGETAPAALVRELREETGVDLADVDPEILSRTYVDDPRNTDHAWICSTVALYRVAAPMTAVGADDALDAQWWPAADMPTLRDALDAAGTQLYEAHASLLALAMDVADRAER